MNTESRITNHESRMSRRSDVPRLAGVLPAGGEKDRLLRESHRGVQAPRPLVAVADKERQLALSRHRRAGGGFVDEVPCDTAPAVLGRDGELRDVRGGR